MSRRRSIRKKKKQEKPLPPMNPMGMERTMQDIHRLLDEQRKYPSLKRKDYVKMGGEDKAIVYYGASVPAWQATSGALEWLARQTQ